MYKEDNSRYISILDICIDFYKTKVTYISSKTVLSLSISVSFIIALLSLSCNNIIANVPYIQIIIMITMIIVGGIAFSISSDFGRDSYFKTLRKLHRAKIEPDQWRLIVMFDDIGIKEANTERILTVENNDSSGLIVGAILLLLCSLLRSSRQTK